MIEGEANFPEPFPLHRGPQRVPVLGIEQQEPAAARAHQFSAYRAVLASDVVPAIDFLVRGSRRPFLFVQPMLMHQLSKTADVAGLDRKSTRLNSSHLGISY